MLYLSSLRLRLLTIAVLGAPALAQVAPNHPHVTWPASAPLPLPDADIRLAPDGTPAEWVGERNAELRSATSLAARRADERALLASIPLLRIDDHAIFGTPHWVASTAMFLTPAVPGDAFDAVAVTRAFVAAHAGLFEFTPEELDFSRRERDYSTRHNGIRHLTFQQQIGGIDLFGAELRANITRHGELMNVSSTMLPRPEGDFSTSAIVLTPLRAIQTAAASIGTRMTVDPEPVSSAAAPNRRLEWSATPDFRTDPPVTTELVYFPMARDDVRSAWKVFLPEIGVGNSYDMLVDATDGRILWRQNRLHFAAGGTQDISMRVYTSDSPAPGSPGNATPNGFQFPFVPRTLVTVTPASVPESPNSWINDGINETQGNNVDAHTDLDANDTPDVPRPTGAPFRVFDFPQDNTQPPSAWRNAATTNLFYFCNNYHDALYALGFDEPAGNFQTDNFGNGGAGNDRVQADCQDGGGTNNANFFTPADGSSGRMQQYVFTGPTPDRDSDLDSEIVYHEFSHGLSNRLHNLQVSGTQAGGMGEGWGDYFGISLNAEPTDDPNATYSTGGYSVLLFAAGFTDNYYFGIRRFPYSSDVNKNPQTFADIDPAQQAYPPGIPRSPAIGNTANEVHNVGEVWCNMLLDVRSSLWASLGFAGNARLMQLVVDGMKLDPGTPNFLQARDSILQADMAGFGGSDLAALWTGFAKRGCGYSATSPSGSTSNGVVEAFDLPIIFTYPAGIPTQLQPNQTTTFQVEIDGIGALQPVAGTGTLWVSVNGGLFVQTPMTETSPNNYDATLPPGDCFDDFRFYLRTDTTSGNAVNPAGAPGSFYAATVFTGTAVNFTDNFESNQGWTATSSGATSGFWERGIPVNDQSWAYGPTADADPTGSGQCYVTQNLAGNTDVDAGSVTLTSPNIDMTGGADISYSYYLFLTEETGVDRLLVEINSNGGAGAWTTIFNHTSSGANNWRQNTITEGTIAGLGVSFTSTMKVRFTANDGDPQSINEAGLDAFTVSKRLCEDSPFASFCFGDGSEGNCPCTNNGDPGNGCNNSIGTGGANLSATGTTTPDTVVFTSTGEMPTALTLFVQGDVQISPVNFGDARRCVDGNLKRLYVKSAVGGVASAPGGGDPSVTARSATLGDNIPSGGTRYYFAYYRDPNPVFCPMPTGSTFNATNSFSIVW